MKRRWGLAPLLTVAMVSIIVLFISITTMLDIRRTTNIFWDQHERSGVLMIEGINDQVVDALYLLNLERLDSLALVVSSRPDFNRLQIFTPQGRTLVDAQSDYATANISDPENKYPVDDVAQPFGMLALAEQRILVETDDQILEIAWPITVGDRTFGGVYLALGSESLRLQIKGIILEHIWQGMALLVIGMALAYLISNFVTKPIRRLTTVAQDMGSGNLVVKVPVGGTNEVSQLGQTLEYMRVELQALYDQLEQRVEQRTRELGEANEELKREITERERAQDERRSLEIKALAQSKLATLGEVATGLAHEINQPLTYISTIGQVILEDIKIDQFDPERAESQLSEAYRQVGRINRIIQHLRTFGRADDGEVAPVDLETALDNTLLLLGQRIRLANINLEREIAPDTPKAIGSANQLEQVFINLFQNSIDALEACSKQRNIGIRLAAGSSEERGGPSVHLEFYDDGGGIPSEYIDKIFEPFFTTKPVGQGTGLGLSIVYGIIRDHGGTITCESESDLGTRFIITLPAEGGTNG